MKLLNTLILAAAAFGAAGCASTKGANDDLAAATAQVLALPASEVTITSREDKLTQTNYWVKTAAGKEYSCMRTSMGGLAKSTPLCNAKGEATVAGSCNALLKAAGKC